MKTKDTPKKEAILTESFSLFLARGYDAVSISDIEQAAGVTRGAIFHHFSSKKELFKEVANKFTFTFLLGNNDEDECQTSNKPLKEYIDKSLVKMEERMNFFFEKTKGTVTAAAYLRFILYITSNYQEGKESALLYYEQKKSSWLRVIEQSKACKEIRPDTDSNQLAETMHAIYMGMAYKGATKEGMDISELRSLWENMYLLLSCK